MYPVYCVQLNQKKKKEKALTAVTVQANTQTKQPVEMLNCLGGHGVWEGSDMTGHASSACLIILQFMSYGDPCLGSTMFLICTKC